MTLAIDKSSIAEEIPFDNTITGELVAEDTQAAIDELTNKINTSASPGFSFGKSGNVAANSYLNNETVPSNIAGRFVYISSAVITRVFVSTQNIDTFDLNIYSHEGDEINLTLLGSVSVVAARGGEFTVNLAVATSKQLAIRVVNGSAKNVVAGLELEVTN